MRLGDRRVRWIAVASLALMAAGCLIVWNHRPSPATVPPVSQPSAAGPMAPNSANSAQPEAIATPTYLRVASIGVSTPLSALGLQADQTVEVPSDPDDAGWFDLGTSPGEVGSAVILGHIDSTAGPAIFSRLHELAPGRQIEVSMSNGAVVTFEVTSVETFLKTSFPAERVYGLQGGKRLNLVTCGGRFEKSKGHYESNVVAFTRWVSSTPANAMFRASPVRGHRKSRTAT